MSDQAADGEHTNQHATDSEIFAVLRRVKEEDGIPALVTSQFNDVWEYDYSNEGLHKRLTALHEDGILGHMKASNRHIWWLSSEGETEQTSLSTLEELVRYDDLPADEFSAEKAREIAAENIPEFGSNFWDRLFETGDSIMRLAIVAFFGSLGILISEQQYMPQGLLAGGLVGGLMLGLIAGGYYLVGYIGTKIHKWGYISEEPLEEKTVLGYVKDEIIGGDRKGSD